MLPPKLCQGTLLLWMQFCLAKSSSKSICSQLKVSTDQSQLGCSILCLMLNLYWGFKFLINSKGVNRKHLKCFRTSKICLIQHWLPIFCFTRLTTVICSSIPLPDSPAVHVLPMPCVFTDTLLRFKLMVAICLNRHDSPMQCFTPHFNHAFYSFKLNELILRLNL